MTRYRRTEWGARAPEPGPGRADLRAVTGIVLHWPAMAKPLRGFKAVSAGLRGWQAYHMDTHGWSDIAYQEAIDQDGNVYVLRGLRTQPGANGDSASNITNGALLLILAPGEYPTDKMVKAVKRRIKRHRDIFPNARAIRSHNDVRPEPTACPGPIVTDMIRTGEFNP